MKKKTRTARKVLSVFLSVLMMLTACIVAVPGLAFAADSYYVRVYLNIYDGANSDGYGNPYTVVTDKNSEFYGKPDGYKWDYGSSWNAFDNSKGYDGEVNMAGFTLFYANDEKFETYDLSADLVAATTELGNKWTSMDELTLENFDSCSDKVEKVYEFELDAMPSSLFWINDENNAVNGETSFGIHKITIAESSESQEHILWTGLSGSESYYECYYGTITPTGLITPWDDCPDEATRSFYKDYTTSAIGTWIDPFYAGDYNIYPVNNYLSGGVSAAFTVGNSGSQTNIDYVDPGTTNNYFINFTNHSTQDATITLFKAENKKLLTNYYDNYPILSGQTVSFALDKASMGSDGNYVDFSFKYKLDNVFKSDGTTQDDFYQAAGIGVWNTADDSSEVGYPDGEASNKGFTLKNNEDIDVMNQFAADVGIFETVSTENNETDNVGFEYKYWIDTSNYTDWSQTGFRLYVRRWNNYKIHLQSSGTSGTMSIGGNIANSNASLGMADLATSYTFATDELKDVDNWAYVGTTCTPFWEGVNSNTEGTLYSNNQSGVFRYTGNIFRNGAATTDPATITFNNMTWVCPATWFGGTTRYAYFSGTINVYAFDKSELRSYVRSLGGLGANWAPMRDRFKDSYWNAYEIALKDAKKVLANQKTNQKAVTDAYNELYRTTEALKSTESLKSQIAKVTYTQRSSDYNSTVTATTEKYLVMPIGTETAVPAYDTYKYATNGAVVGKQSSNLKTNYTQYDTGINPIDYRYWKIDFTGVAEAIARADEIINKRPQTYSAIFVTNVEAAKEKLTLFDRDEDTYSPSHQSDITDSISELDALIAHGNLPEDDYSSCVYDSADTDDLPDIVETKDVTCFEDGYEKHICLICGKAKTVSVEKAKGSHSVEAWTSVDGENHEGTCTVCGEEVTEPHSCADNDHKCDSCGITLSECADNDNDHNCDVCGTELSECADNDNDHNCDVCGTELSECADNDSDHKCDICGTTLSECADEDNDHKCDICGIKLSECADEDNDHKCDVCGTTLSKCVDEDNDHNCDVCGTELSECADNDNDHNCDVCGTELSECADNDNDHNCDVCGTELSDCADNDKDHNCDVCGDKLSDCADNNKDHKCDVCGTELSECADGNSDHKCDICGTTLSECADEDNDHKCDVCGTELSECADNDKDHKCDTCGETLSECTWGTPVLTKAPSATEKGEYTEICDICGTTQITKVDLADYREFNTAVEALKELAKTENLTDEAKTVITDALAEAEALDKNLPADVETADGKEIKGGQDEIDALTDEINGIITDTEAGIEDGTMVYVDLSAYNEALGVYNSETVLVAKEEDKAAAQTAIDSVADITAATTKANGNQDKLDVAAEVLAGLNAKYAKCANGEHDYEGVTTEPTCTAQGYTTYTCTVCGNGYSSDYVNANGHSWSTEGTFTADTSVAPYVGYYTYTCTAENCDGELKIEVEAADYSELESLVEALEKIITDNPDLTDDAKTEIQKAIDKAEALPDDLTKKATEEDVTTPDGQSQIEELVAELKDVKTEAEKDIADGSALEPDYSAWEEAETAYDALVKTNVKDEILTEAEALKAEIADKQANTDLTQATATQKDIDDAAARLNEIIDGIEDGSLIKDADFSKVDEDLADAKDKADKNDVVDGVKEDIEAIEDKIEELKKDATADDQDEIDNLEEQLEGIIAGITDGSLVKPDYSVWEEAETAYDALDKTNADAGILAEAEALKAEIADKQANTDLTQATATQKEIDDAAVRLNEIIDGIEDGSLVKDADFTEAEKDLADAKDKADKNDVIDGVKEDIQEIENKLNELKNDPETNINDQNEIDALEIELEEIIAGIENGSLVKPDYTEAEEAISKAEQNIDNGGKLTEEDKAALDELKNSLNEIRNDSASNKKDDQDAVNSIKDQIQQISDKYAECAKGNHTGTERVIAPDCDTMGYTEYICNICGKYYTDNFVNPLGHTEKIIPAVEPTCSAIGYTEGKECTVCGKITVEPKGISKLPHTDGDENGVCDVCGDTELYAGCVCLCHNTHWFWHIIYLIVRIIWRVFNIHQYCPCGAVHF